MNLKTFIKQSKLVKKMGFVATMRKGNTGVGHTFEQLVGLKENNIASPDIGGKVELKVQRKRATNRITLFTKSPKWVIRPMEIIKKYGYINGNRRLALKVTFVGLNPVRGLRIRFDAKKDQIQIVDSEHTLLAYWESDDIVKLFKHKLPKLILVKADVIVKNNIEKFNFNEGFYLTLPNEIGILKSLTDKSLAIELRMHINNDNSLRDHGTGFRMTEAKLDMLYGKKKKII